MALQDEITRIKQAKADIKASIEAKGGSVGNGLIDTYASAIDNLPSGGGDIYEYFPEKITSSNTRMYKEIKKVPSIDISSLNSLEYFYQDCQSLEEVPFLDTTHITNMTSMHDNNYALKILPNYNTSNVTSFSTFCRNNRALETFPQLDMSKATRIDNLLYGCSLLKTVPSLNTILAKSFYALFRDCSKLESIGELRGDACENLTYAFDSCSALINFGGIKNIGMAYSTTQSANYSKYTLTLSNCTKLTHDSLMNVINNLYDIATKGCNPQKLILGSTNLAKLTAEEIAIATNKGWVVS